MRPAIAGLALLSVLLTAVLTGAASAALASTAPLPPAAEARRLDLNEEFAWRTWFRAQNLHRDRGVLIPEDLDEALDLFARMNFYEVDGEVRVFVPGAMAYVPARVLDEGDRRRALSDPTVPLVLARRDLDDPQRLAAAAEIVARVPETGPDGTLQAELSREARQRLAEIVVFYDLALVAQARRMVEILGRDAVEPRHLNGASAMLMYWTGVDGWTSGLEFARRAFAQNMSFFLVKRQRLRPSGNRLDAAEKRQLQGELAGLPLTRGASERLDELLRQLALDVWRRAQAAHPRGERVLLGERDVYAAVETTLPWVFEDDGGVTFSPGSPAAGTPAAVTLASFDVEAWRESAASWQLLADLLWEHGVDGATEPPAGAVLPLDYPASEELSDFLVSYTVLLLGQAATDALEAGAGELDAEVLEAAHRRLLERPPRSETAPPPAAPAEPIFVEVTAEVGLLPFAEPMEIDTPEGLSEAPSLMAHDAFRGVSTADVDGDDRPDLFVAEERGGSRLYRNTGRGTFEDMTAAAGLAGIPRVSGGYFADVDNDGCVDLLILRSHLPSLLWRNRCDGTFVDVTARSGLGRSGLPTTGAAWLDADLDGHLDLYLIQTGRFDRGYLPSRGDVWNAEPNVLWRNRGDGTFEDVTERAGVGERGLALAVAATDFDADGDPDLFVANDMQRDVLFENLGDGRFRNVAREAGVDDLANGMGVSVGDVDHDGWLDLYVTNIFRSRSRTRDLPQRPGGGGGPRHQQSNRLYLNGGDGTFRDAHEELIEAAPLGWGWDSFFFDYDNDGHLDLYVINGFRPDYTPFQYERNLLFHRDPESGLFENVSEGSGAGIYSVSRAGVYFDADADGDLDLVVTGLHSPRFFRNRAERLGRHWLSLRLVGRGGQDGAHRDAFGARVRVSAGGLTQTLELGNQGGGFISSIHGGLHFGLGSAAKVDRIEIHWPGGGVQELVDVPADQRLVVEQER